MESTLPPSLSRLLLPPLRESRLELALPDSTPFSLQPGSFQTRPSPSSSARGQQLEARGGARPDPRILAPLVRSIPTQGCGPGSPQRQSRNFKGELWKDHLKGEEKAVNFTACVRAQCTWHETSCGTGPQLLHWLQWSDAS
ncbi:unnamed protein product [Eretmochelys imbricata]